MDTFPLVGYFCKNLLAKCFTSNTIKFCLLVYDFGYSTANETRQFLICPRFAINLVNIQNMVIDHDTQLNRANEILKISHQRLTSLWRSYVLHNLRCARS